MNITYNILFDLDLRPQNPRQKEVCFMMLLIVLNMTTNVEFEI